MRTLVTKYKSVITFVLLFLGTYLVLSFCYSIYLEYSKDDSSHPDFITELVAKQSVALMNEFDYDVKIDANTSSPDLDLMINNKNIGSIIEGCNSVSIIILFIAFIVSFTQSFKKTAVFILAGSVLIYCVNLIRIVILLIAIYHYPKYQDVLHIVVFPAIIYGLVFLLWMLWVKNVVPISKRNDEV